MRGGMRLAEFSSTLHDYWRRQEDYTEALPPFKVESTQRLLRVRLVRIGSGLNGGTLIYLEDLGRAQNEAQQMKLAALGRLTASIAHEVRNPLSAINQAAQLLEEDGVVPPAGARLLGMIRNNAKRHRPHRRRSIAAEPPRPAGARSRQPRRVHAFADRRNRPGGKRAAERDRDPDPERRPGDVRSRSPQPDRLNLVRNAWQHCRKKEGSIRTPPARIHGGCDNLRARGRRTRDPRRAARPDLRAVLHDAPGRHRLGLYIARELADANGAALELLPRGPGAHFRMTMKRAFHPVVNKR